MIYGAALCTLLGVGLLAGCWSAAARNASQTASGQTAEALSAAQEKTAYPDLLTQSELDQCTQAMREYYGTLFSAPFSSFDQIDVALILNDGTDTSKPTTAFTDEDREALAQLGLDLDVELDDCLGVKLTGAEINAYLGQVYGFTLSDEELQERVVEQSLDNDWGQWYYSPANDTYYHFSNGTASQVVTCTFGLRRTDGHVILNCNNLWGAQSWQVELVPNGDSYQFAAIVEVTES
jgi:hypothetical protein